MSTAELKSTTTENLVTAEQLIRDFQDVRCDLIEGRVYEMAPPGFGHGSIEVRISRLLGNYVEEHELGVVAAGETGFLVSREPDTVLGADVAFVTRERIEEIGVTAKYFPEAPALAVEIVSPGDSAEQVDSKARRWLAAGAQIVWVVYPSGLSVTDYRSLDNIRVLTSEQTLDGGDVVPGFAVKVAEIFAGLS